MSPLRTREIARIHVLKKDLQLDDDTYRDLLLRVGGKASSKDLTADGRRLVLDELTRLGGAKQYPGKPNNLEERPELQRIEALLAEAKRPWAYADGIAQQMFGVERMQFCSPDQTRAVLTALMKDAKKHGRRTK